MADSCIAHIRPNADGTQTIQTAADHCRETARLAALLLHPVGLGQTGFLAGLLHDFGKFTARFTDYIRRAANGGDVRRGAVNHTFGGVRFLLTRYHAETFRSFRDIACEILAYAVGAHHGQFDCIDPNGGSGFVHRLEKEDICYEEALANFLSQCAGEAELDALFAQSVQEIETIHRKLLLAASKKEEEGAFFYAMLCRLALSAVIDADRRDTAAFMGAYTAPQFPDALRPVWDARLAYLEQRLSEFPSDSPIARARQEISAACRASAGQKSGAYRLYVPTGAGKTLSALRYALAHAAAHGKRRIIFITPLLSVLDQNAQVIRDFIGDDSLILEHHSNVIYTHDDPDRLDPQELLAETWDAPIVISTLAQLLNALFLGKTTAIRRMNALTGSVIVMDEIQSLPRHMLSQCNLALNFLSEVCGATIVLCSATQPCLETLPHPLHYSPNADLVSYNPTLWDAFRRTEVFDRQTPGGCSVEQLAAFALDCLNRAGSVLLICNTKGQAKSLYQQLLGSGCRLYHLSTAMCPQHRMDTLAAIQQDLSNGERVLCVATQLVEAGIDFSFRTVLRVCAGMDNVAQAAGRCNRSGEAGHLCPVYIVRLRGEDLRRLPEIRASQNASTALLTQFARDPDAFGNDLLSDASIRYYYRRLFAEMDAGAADYPLPDLDTSMFHLLSKNSTLGERSAIYREKRYYINQAFATAGARFHVFQSNTTDLLVPYGAGADCIAALSSDRAKYDPVFCKTELEKAKRFTVSLYDYQIHKLNDQGGLRSFASMQSVLPNFYDPQAGVTTDPGKIDFLEV